MKRKIGNCAHSTTKDTVEIVTKIVPSSMQILFVNFTKIPESVGSKTAVKGIQNYVDMDIDASTELPVDIFIKIYNVNDANSFRHIITIVNSAGMLLLLRMLKTLNAKLNTYQQLGGYLVILHIV